MEVDAPAMSASFIPVLLGLAAGLATGVFQFATLHRLSAMYLAGASPARTIALQLARLALVAAVLFGLAQLGAPALLAGALGIFLGRAVVLRRTGRGA
jgi:F1F0 ATPase subunit 2